MADRDDNWKGMASFNGDISKYPDFRSRCRALYAETEDSKRHLVGPAIWRRLRGSAWTALRHVDPEMLRAPEGFDKLLAMMDNAFQWQPVTDLQQKLDDYLFMPGRAKQEGITAFLARERACLDRFVEIVQKYMDDETKVRNDKLSRDFTYDKLKYREDYAQWKERKEDWARGWDPNSLEDGEEEEEYDEPPPQEPMKPRELDTPRFHWPEVLGGHLLLKHLGLIGGQRSALIRACGGNIKRSTLEGSLEDQ